MAQSKEFQWDVGAWCDKMKDAARCAGVYLKLPLLFYMSSELWVQLWLF